MKHCSKCNTDKPLNEFYKGTNPYCRECTSLYRQELLRENRDVLRLSKEMTLGDIKDSNESISVYELLRHKL